MSNFCPNEQLFPIPGTGAIIDDVVYSNIIIMIIGIRILVTYFKIFLPFIAGIRNFKRKSPKIRNLFLKLHSHRPRLENHNNNMHNKMLCKL